MKVGIVGAGVAGLAAAQTLVRAGHDVVVFEKSKRPGGRCASRPLEGFLFDTGATTITPRHYQLGKWMLETLDRTNLVQIERSIYTHTGLRPSPGDPARNAIPRYTYRTGISELGRLLAEGVDVRYEAKIESIEAVADHRYVVAGEPFDGLILTPPVPQTRELLAQIGETRPLANAKYRTCLSVLLGYRIPTPEVPYFALLDPEQRHPVTWLSLESAKCPDRAPEGCCAVVVQMSASYSQRHYESDDEAIVDQATDGLRLLFGPDWRSPAVSAVKRWRYSQPESSALFHHVNSTAKTLMIAGDGVSGPRIEMAFETGVAAAERLMERAVG
ncbi:MAG: FAD-dependent oxidoreductase [Fimbriimonadaceae bacterium]